MTERPDADAAIRARIPYDPIVDRAPLRLPGGAKVAVWVIVNVEMWNANRAMPRTVLPPPMGQPLLPDVPNWAWHEYGMRVGYWRFVDALRRRDIRATLAVNGSACQTYARACLAARDLGWEFIGHGFNQRPMHQEDDQARVIKETMQVIEEVSGRAPRGWESPGITETLETADLLKEAGIEYVCDWVLDDQPVTLHTAAGPLVSVPYTVEINDVVISAVEKQPSDEIFRRGRAQFDRLVQDGQETARVMAISIHPYLTGAPHRIRYLEELLDYVTGHEGVVMWTGEQILDWYRAEASA